MYIASTLLQRMPKGFQEGVLNGDVARFYWNISKPIPHSHTPFFCGIIDETKTGGHSVISTAKISHHGPLQVWFY